jgi:hypothetical protein
MVPVPILLAVPVLIRTSPLCTTPTEIKKELAALDVPLARPEDEAPAQLSVTPLQEGFFVELKDAGGIPIEARTISSPTDAPVETPAGPHSEAACPKIPRQVATLVKAWMLELPPPPKPATPFPIPLTPSRRSEFGLAVRALFQQPQLVPAFSIDWVERRLLSDFGARLALNLALPRQEPLDSLTSGRVSWTRFNADIGLIYGWEAGPMFLDLHAEAILGAFVAWGTGWEEDRFRTAFDAGFGGGLRSGVRLGSVRIWFDVAILGWLVGHTIAVTGIPSAKSSDTAEASFSVGASFLK